MAHKPQIEALERSEKHGHVSFNSKMLPEVKDWKVGKTYKVEVTMEQKSMSEFEEGVVDASFDVKKVKVV